MASPPRILVARGTTNMLPQVAAVPCGNAYRRSVALAVELYVDPAADGVIRSVWAELELAGVPSLATASHGRHHPHVSLAVTDGLDIARLTADLGATVRLSPPVPLTMVSVGVFPRPGGTNVVFLGVATCPALLAAQCAAVEAVRAAGGTVWADYLVGHWVAHCTLAMPVADARLGAAVGAAMVTPLPVLATAVGLSVVDTVTGADVVQLSLTR